LAPALKAGFSSALNVNFIEFIISIEEREGKEAKKLQMIQAD